MRFVGQQIVQRLIPQPQLLEGHFHAPALLPLRLPTAAASRDDIEILQPLGQGVLTARPREPIRQQYEDSFGERLAVAPGCRDPVEDRPQSQLVEQVAGGAERPPAPGLRRGDLFTGHPAGRLLVGLQQAHQRVQMGRQQVFAAQVSDDPLAGLAVEAIGLDQAEVGVVTGLVGAQEHGRAGTLQ